MKAPRHFRALLAALFAVAGAHAQEGTQEFANQTLSTQGRAEVRAELEAARNAGTLDRRNHASHGVFAPTVGTSARSGGDALAGVEKARAVGARPNQGERSGS